MAEITYYYPHPSHDYTAGRIPAGEYRAVVRKGELIVGMSKPFTVEDTCESAQ